MQPRMFESHIQRSDWEPGNATRYDLLYGEYLDSRGKPMFFITWLENAGAGGVTLNWSGDSLHWSYVCEKMGINIANAAGIMAYLKTQGHDVMMPEDFNDDGVWDPKPQALEK